ncbi:MAG: class I SAM-dependent methyltransferase [Gammaproteobacteria bacterium]|nr:class I SAM-dependent methyltransferase [Gammaproteobacteria bacterium]
MFTIRGMKPHVIQKPLTFLFSKPQYKPAHLTPSLFRQHSTTTRFFQVIQAAGGSNLRAMTALLQNEHQLKEALDKINQGVLSSYLHENFIFWLNAYAKQAGSFCAGYLAGNVSLNTVCKDFIRFCFDNNIYLDPTRTLASFKKHNELSDNAVRRELEQLTPRQEINLLGFGLDGGHYEQSIAAYLLSSGKAGKVNLFGFDPYAKRNPDIRYLSANELSSSDRSFDLIVARWVLHHVEMKSRWSTFVDCINRCHPGAEVLIVEHGYLDEVSLLDRKLSALLNATFDVVANIGLRPGYFLSTPNVGDDFFIEYLEPKDFSAISAQVSVKYGVKIYDVGPDFPNQTICKMSVK